MLTAQVSRLYQSEVLIPVCTAVTFLALGNGAPDISASIAAVRAGQYKLALGSLLGTPSKLPRRLHLTNGSP